MQILLPEQLAEWIRLDPETDTMTLDMLEASAIEYVESVTGLPLIDRETASGVTIPAITPIPQSILHAIAVYVHGHYEERTGSVDAAMVAVKRLLGPYWRIAL